MSVLSKSNSGVKSKLRFQFQDEMVHFAVVAVRKISERKITTDLTVDELLEKRVALNNYPYLVCKILAGEQEKFKIVDRGESLTIQCGFLSFLDRNEFLVRPLSLKSSELCDDGSMTYVFQYDVIEVNYEYSEEIRGRVNRTFFTR